MQFPKLECGLFLRRRKRFLVDLALPGGGELTVDCPNTGAMTGCLEPNAKAYFSHSDNPERKYAHTLEWLELESGQRACINTQRPNQLVAEALRQAVIGELNAYDSVKPEQQYGREGSRVDFKLADQAGQEADCYLEVKNVTLCEGDIGYFPDAVSLRALKHLRELVYERARGSRAALLFCINHTGIKVLRPAAKVDMDYARLLKEVADEGVELLAYRTIINAREIRLTESVPIEL